MLKYFAAIFAYVCHRFAFMHGTRYVRFKCMRVLYAGDVVVRAPMANLANERISTFMVHMSLVTSRIRSAAMRILLFA